jgi:flagellar hook-basal body complex protein FliE
MNVDAASPLSPLSRLAPLSRPVESAEPTAGFAGLLTNALAAADQSNATANAAIQDLATGKAQDLHQVSLAVAEADLSFRMMLELRNRLTESFQEVARMQV